MLVNNEPGKIFLHNVLRLLGSKFLNKPTIFRKFEKDCALIKEVNIHF